MQKWKGVAIECDHSRPIPWNETPQSHVTGRYDPEVENKPKRLGNTFLSWIKPVLTYPEEDILKTSGMDVVVFIRLMSYGAFRGRQHQCMYGPLKSCEGGQYVPFQKNDPFQ